jgi:hypothetical protein
MPQGVIPEAAQRGCPESSVTRGGMDSRLAGFTRAPE